jgi:hypothetical protein
MKNITVMSENNRCRWDVWWPFRVDLRAFNDDSLLTIDKSSTELSPPEPEMKCQVPCLKAWTRKDAVLKASHGGVGFLLEKISGVSLTFHHSNE